ncbi:unnamed protein product [Arctia plantaginis]|uniref:Uncharacterized protein n=1 Tax=Arctia plantaginis TaxID=874455 RepID=A0A8S0ZKT3_ARCPL|nr:unnamed protein product [Arctia plantaginis]
MLRAREEDYQVAGPSTSTEVVPVDQLSVDRQQLIRQAAACYEQTVKNINVLNSEDVQVGPKFISVSQNVENIEVARGRILGLQLVSRQMNKPLRCSVAVFVCWTLVVAIILISFIFYMVFNKNPTRLDLDIHEPWYLRRDDWYANDDRGITLLNLPISMVIISHSVREYCTEKYQCVQYVLDIQRDHLTENRWDDIGPNFLVGGNGYVFEGRGANVLGEMVKFFDYKSISIMFLGNYVYDKPTLAMFDNLSVLFKELVNKRVLTTDYKVYGQCQVIGAIVKPGPNVMDNLHHFDHWDPKNRSSCMTLQYS